MTVANLPPLRAGLRTPDVPGVWRAEELNLDELADALNTEAEVGQASQLKSIPDAWAQVQIARLALMASEGGAHPAAAAVKREWRALLALLALQPTYEAVYEVVLEHLQLGAPPATDAAIAEPERFRAVLSLLPPKAKLFAAPDAWSSLSFLAVRSLGAPASEQIVGLLSPDILISPGKSTSRVSIPGVPWFENGPKDPTTVEDMTNRDLSVLANYLDQVRQQLYASRAQTTAPALLEGVLKALESYRADCASRLGGEAYATAPRQLLGHAVQHALHQSLFHTFIAEPPGDENGPCYLAVRNDLPAPFAGVILADACVAEARRIPPARLRVWRGGQLSDARDRRLLDEMREEAGREGYLLITADDLFTRDFIELEPKSDIPGHPIGGFRSSLLPLTPLALLIQSPSALAEAVKVQPGAGGERHVHLTLRLTDNQQVTLTRTYRPNDPAARAWSGIARPVSLAIWPDFRRADWPWNFLRYQQDPSSQNLQTRFGASGAQIAADVCQLNDNRERAARARAWCSPAEVDRLDLAIEGRVMAGKLTPEDHQRPIVPLQRLRFASEDDEVGELQISERPFEALFFARRADANSGPSPVGMVLLSLPRADEDKGGAPTVAIDFGTTNTVAAADVGFESKDGARRLALDFQPRTIFPIEPAEASRKRESRSAVAWSLIDFFPLIDQPTPVPTVARKRHTSGDAPNRQQIEKDDRPLFADSIFFLAGFDTGHRLERRISTVVLRELDRLAFNLKWNQQQVLTRHFLQQFMIMSAAELAARGYAPSSIRWRFSYPQAMQEEDSDFLASTYRGFARKLFPPRAGQEASPSVQGYTESDAAAHYFMSQPTGDTTIVLDIGGGTTDIAIWLRGQPARLIWQGSVKIAGGDFMTHYLVNNSDFLRQLQIEEIDQVIANFGGETSDLLSSQDATSRPRLREFAELFFNDERFSGSFERAYGASATRPLGAGLRHCAVAAAGGVLYYLGKVIRRLIEEGLLTEENLHAPTIAFAGRGALFLKMLGGDNPALSRRLRGLSMMMSRGGDLGWTHESATVLFSPEPKLEAVLGMLKEHAGDIRTPTGTEKHWAGFLPIGEAFQWKGGEGPTAWEDVRSLAGQERRARPRLTEFEAYLDALSDECGVAIELGEDVAGAAKQLIVNHVNTRLLQDIKSTQDVQSRTRGTKTFHIEPPFIVGLRALLHCLGQNADTRRGLMRVEENR